MEVKLHVDVIAARIDVDANSLVLRMALSSCSLLVLPKLALRWSRLTGAQGHVLPFLTDVELRGIPNHKWETSTMDRRLSPHVWVQKVHSDTLGLVDLSSFRCLA
jgi:hypothetical protein